MKTLRIALIALASLTAGVAAQAQYGQYPPSSQQPAPYPGSQQQYGQQQYGYDDNYDNYDNYVGDDEYGSYDQYSSAYDTRSASVDLGIFYRELSPYGQWIRHPYYGWVWFPRNVGYQWRPYTLGRWVNSNYGWTWVSYEQFGWATYHYGRWAFDRQIGWIWVPGTVWGPAWVAWQQGSGYIGWAPLPPQVGFQAGVGIRLGGLNISLSLAPTTYSFVDERAFLESRLDRYIQPSARNITIIRSTRNITDYGWENNRIINRGVPVERIEQITRRVVRRLEVRDSPSRSSEIGRDEVRIYRPSPEVLRSAPSIQRNDEGVRLQPREERQRRQVAPPAESRPDEVYRSPRPSESGNSDFDRVQRNQQRELERAAQEDRRKLEKVQQQDTREQRENRGQIQAQHQAELKAQQDLLKRQEQVMRNRLQIQRQLEGKDKDKDQSEKEQDGRNKRSKKDKGDDSPPPPPRF